MVWMLLVAGMVCLPGVLWAGSTVAQEGSVAASAPGLGQVRHDDAHAALTLKQAVKRVQSRTHGRVLRASKRKYGDATEYLVKVLTPDGHVQVVSVRSHSRDTSENMQKETH